MATLKNILFARYAGKALESLVIEMQKKYIEKRGRRFNHDNITYEISRANENDENIQFEIRVVEEPDRQSGLFSHFFNERLVATKPAFCGVDFSLHQSGVHNGPIHLH